MRTTTSATSDTTSVNEEIVIWSNAISLCYHNSMRQRKRIYLDYAATTPTDPKVVQVVSRVMRQVGGNPASLYEEGRTAKKTLEDERISIANSMRAHPDEIIFTSGGTESNNLAIFGSIESLWRPGVHAAWTPGLHIVTTTIEHSSVLEPIRKLEREGLKVTYLKPNKEGLIEPKSVRDALQPNTALVSIMYANNEIGTIQPIKDIAKVIRHFCKEHNQSLPYFHTDAAQAAGYLSLDTLKLGVDLMTIDGGKIYGPKGVGLLFKKRGVNLLPLMVGGGQESGLRSGTENVALIAGLAKAFVLNERMKEREVVRITKLRDYFIKHLLELPGASLNGSVTERLPNNVSVCFKDLDAEFAVYRLDERGVAVSSASTCMNLKEDSYSYVVEEIGKSECRASSLRFSLGRSTTQKDISICLKALKEVLLMQKIV